MDISEILDNIYIWVFLVNSESLLHLAFVKYIFYSRCTQNCIFLYFWRLKILVLWRKMVQNLLIFAYLFCPKNSTIDFRKTVRRKKLPDPSLNRIFNPLSICAQYLLSFQWFNFGLKFSLIIKSSFLTKIKKTKLVPASFSEFLELLREKNKF